VKCFDRMVIEVTRAYAFRAARYRRVARAHCDTMDFSREALLSLYHHESSGQGSAPDKSVNGFAYGKWLVDLSVSMMVESVQKGEFAKIEFLGTPLERMHNAGVLKNVYITPVFIGQSPYCKEQRFMS
jgi:hypothetical protein